jgi:diguanylate cyclase (GGDEF)-like protein
MTLYAVGTAFVVLMLATERTSRTHKDAAATDELTGLFNRRGVLQAAQELIARQAQKGEAASALMFDLDLFKSINDKLGHRIGDEALRLFAATARASTRATDIVGRFGGDEFVALLPGNLAGAEVVAERVRRAFEIDAVTVAGQAAPWGSARSSPLRGVSRCVEPRRNRFAPRAWGRESTGTCVGQGQGVQRLLYRCDATMGHVASSSAHRRHICARGQCGACGLGIGLPVHLVRRI